MGILSWILYLVKHMFPMLLSDGSMLMNLKSAFQYRSHLRLLKIFILFTSYFLPDGFWRIRIFSEYESHTVGDEEDVEISASANLRPFRCSFFLDVLHKFLWFFLSTIHDPG